VVQDGRSEDHLIAPAPTWDDWDDAAETVHGISRAMLQAERKPHEEVANRMAEALTGHDLFASAPLRLAFSAARQRAKGVKAENEDSGTRHRRAPCRIRAGPSASAALDRPSEEELAWQRETMVEAVASMAAAARVRGARQIDPAVLDAMRSVPRHRLVPAEAAANAYDNNPLPIGHEQTISQPFIVALMTHLLGPERHHVVLEVGTGSGYQAGMLSRLVRRVYTIEIVPQLAERAAADLAALGYGNIIVRQGDGYAGWPEHAPFDGIIVTAGAERIPEPLLAQLKPGGRMVIPLGSSHDQQLTLVTKSREGRIRREALLPVRFVPFTGGASAPK